MAVAPVSSPASAARADTASYVDWPAILAGTVIAVAIAFMLLTFGSAIGLSAVSVAPGEGASLFWIGIVSGLWFLWVVVSSFAAGGYVAGRLRRPVADATADEIETRDGAHGVVVWAAGVLLAALLAASGVAGVVASVGAAAGTVADVASDAVGGSLDTIAARLTRGGDTGAPEAGAVREDVAGIVASGLRDGQVDDGDRTYLAELVAERSGLPPEEAAARVDAAIAEAQQLYDEAIEAAEQARRAAAIAAFVIAASLFVAGAAAYFAAAAGGQHRDQNLAFSRFGR